MPSKKKNRLTEENVNKALLSIFKPKAYFLVRHKLYTCPRCKNKLIKEKKLLESINDIEIFVPHDVMEYKMNMEAIQSGHPNMYIGAKFFTLNCQICKKEIILGRNTSFGKLYL